MKGKFIRTDKLSGKARGSTYHLYDDCGSMAGWGGITIREAEDELLKLLGLKVCKMCLTRSERKTFDDVLVEFLSGWDEHGYADIPEPGELLLEMLSNAGFTVQASHMEP